MIRSGWLMYFRTDLPRKHARTSSSPNSTSPGVALVSNIGYDAINHMELLRACAYSAACAGVPYNLFFSACFSPEAASASRKTGAVVAIPAARLASAEPLTNERRLSPVFFSIILTPFFLYGRRFECYGETLVSRATRSCGPRQQRFIGNRAQNVNSALY